MHIAFDIIHPAHVHFFAPTIKDFISTGHTVRAFSRHKELVCELLDDYGIHHQTLSTARTGVAGLLFEMIVRNPKFISPIPDTVSVDPLDLFFLQIYGSRTLRFILSETPYIPKMFVEIKSTCPSELFSVGSRLEYDTLVPANHCP